MNKLNLTELRQDTPGCDNVLHFNNAGAALMPKPVLQALRNHIDNEAMMGGYEAEAAAAEGLEHFYQAIAQLIHCMPTEIAYAENATRAWDMIFYGLRLQKGDKVLTCMSEYASNYLALLHVAKQAGITVEVIKDDEVGQLDLTDLQNKIDKQVKLIAITHVPTQGGLINPAEEVGKIAKQHNILYLLDATQSVGQMPIDVQAIGCDFLCATGRKYLRGPRGTGFLYMRKELIESFNPPFIDLHAATWCSKTEYQLRQDARRCETWEQNIAAKLGLAAAVDYALKLSMPIIWQQIQQTATYLRQSLQQIPTIALQDLGARKCGLVTFTSQRKSAEEIKQQLNARQINVTVSLQEYARLDLERRHLPALVRASVHYYNTPEEVERFCEVIDDIV